MSTSMVKPFIMLHSLKKKQKTKNPEESKFHDIIIRAHGKAILYVLPTCAVVESFALMHVSSKSKTRRIKNLMIESQSHK